MRKSFVILILSCLSANAEFTPGVYTTDSVYLTCKSIRADPISMDTSKTLADTLLDSIYISEQNDTFSVFYPDTFKIEEDEEDMYVLAMTRSGSVDNPLERLYDSASADEYSQYYMRYNFKPESDTVIMTHMMNINNYFDSGPIVNSGIYSVINDSIIEIDVEHEPLDSLNYHLGYPTNDDNLSGYIDTTFQIKYKNNRITFGMESFTGFGVTQTIYDILDIYPNDTCKACVRLLFSGSEISPVYGGYHFLTKKPSSVMTESNPKSSYNLNIESMGQKLKKIEFPNKSLNKKISVKIFSLSGRCISSQSSEAADSDIMLDIPESASGVYLLKIFGLDKDLSEMILIR